MKYILKGGASGATWQRIAFQPTHPPPHSFCHLFFIFKSKLLKHVIQKCSISIIYFAYKGGGNPVDAGDSQGYNQIEVKIVLMNRNGHRS